MINDIIINIDLLQVPSSNSLFVMQREKDSKRLVFNITSNGQSVGLEGKTVIFCMQKPDGEVIFNNCTIDEEVSVILTSQSQAVNGTCGCWLKVVDGETITYSPGFYLKILGVADFSGAVESSSEFTALESALVAAQKIENLSANATTLAPGDDATAELIDAGETIVLELGIPQGIQGATGNTGASAYDVWLSLGNNGSEQEFIDSLSPVVTYGTFTPKLNTTNSDLTAVYTSRSGQWVKIGGLVFIDIFMNISSITSIGSGFVVIEDLPFTFSRYTTRGNGLCFGLRSMLSENVYSAVVNSSVIRFVLGQGTSATVSELNASGYIGLTGCLYVGE